MARPNRRYKKPHYELSRVHSVASARDIVITTRAVRDATRTLPPDIIDVGVELREIAASLTLEEFVFSERQTRRKDGKELVSVVDVYKIDFEGSECWLKLKLEQDESGDYVVVISFHEWDDSRTI